MCNGFVGRSVRPLQYPLNSWSLHVMSVTPDMY